MEPKTVRARLRIAVALLDLLPIAGLERVILCHADVLTNLGFEVDLVFACEPQNLSGIVPKGARVFQFGTVRLRNFIAPFARYLAREKPDAIHVAGWPLTVFAILAHRLARSRARIIVSDHNTLSAQYAGRGLLHRLFLRSSLAVFYRLATARVAVSNGVAEDLAGLSGIARLGFTVIHNCLSVPIHPNPSTISAMQAAIDQWVHDSARASKGSASPEDAWRGFAGPRVITVGLIKAQKNHVLLIRAFKRLLASRDARLMILGARVDKGTERAVTELISAEGLMDKVLMPGHVADPIPFYQSADLFVLSSDYEGFGNVIIEALACGVPVVSTDCPSGPAEILENGRWGRLVPVGDEMALAEAIAEALYVKHDHEALKQRARDFSADAAVSKYLKLMFPRDPSDQSELQ